MHRRFRFTQFEFDIQLVYGVQRVLNGYIGLGFLAVEEFGTTPTPTPSPPHARHRRHTGRLRKRDSLLIGEGSGRESESYDRKACLIIQYSLHGCVA
jgi:hypothetical protein